MSLNKELESLKKQKVAELERLHWTYLHTKREAKKSLSPDRFVRKHLGATLGVAAVMGMLMAPRPSPRVKAGDEKKGGGGMLSGLLHGIVAAVEKMIPSKKGRTVAVAMTDPAGKGPKIGGMLEMLLPLLLGKLDLTRLISLFMRQVMGMVQRAKKHEGNGHSPEMSVADAGTVKPNEYEDFQ